MTKEEFLHTIGLFGLTPEEHDDRINVYIKSRYGDRLLFLEFSKIEHKSRMLGIAYNSMVGEVKMYIPQPVYSVDGYLVEIMEGNDWMDGQWRKFTKQFKLERILREEIEKLKLYRTQIKLSEIEWDFE